MRHSDEMPLQRGVATGLSPCDWGIDLGLFGAQTRGMPRIDREPFRVLRPADWFRSVLACAWMMGSWSLLHVLGETALTASRAGTHALQQPAAHWAYQPLRQASRPDLSGDDRDWCRGVVDEWMVAGMRARGLSPAPDADRAVLGRRLSFDLIGLPPSSEELNALVLDPAPDDEAIGRWVDRLLASPRFGEHWARRWMDIARYAESVTLRGLIFKEAWRYREYLVDAFNRDVPIDQLIREQIAGDLMPSTTVAETSRKWVATTFLMLGNSNLEEQDKRQLEMDVVDEQLDVIGKAFLGQTIGCARCHDHKFDPISARDYYALAGILKNITPLRHDNVSGWVERPLPLEAGEESVYREHEAGLARLEAEVELVRRRVKSATNAPVVGNGIAVLPASFEGIVVDSSRARRVGTWTESHSVTPYIGEGYLHDGNEGKGTKTLTFHPELTMPGRYEVRLAYTTGANRGTRVPVTVFHAGGETRVIVNQRTVPSVLGHFITLGTYAFETNGFASVLVGTEGTDGYVVADAIQFVRVDVNSPKEGIPAVAAVTEIQSGLSGRSAAITTNDTLVLRELEARLKQLRVAGPVRPKVMAPLEATNVVDLPVLKRGSVHSPVGKVARGFPKTLAATSATSPSATQSGRMELAEWIVSPGNALARRVMVNRFWVWMMGEGLVRTPDNFGTTGEAPTHPELLETLAERFGREGGATGGMGWSAKALVREIALSRTYRQQSIVGSPTDKDPDNRGWSRALRKTLTAEQLRDAMLVVGGGVDFRGFRWIGRRITALRVPAIGGRSICRNSGMRCRTLSRCLMVPRPRWSRDVGIGGWWLRRHCI